MQIIEVNDKKSRKEFLALAPELYRNEKNWVRPLDNDIEMVFDPEKNKFFRHGECARWLLQDAGGQAIGRVAAFINRRTVDKDNEQPTGGMGFFECINDREAAFKLLDTCKQWLQERGMEAMDGPINFGDRDRWWGLLVDGFDLEPNYCCNYNFPYYRELFEAYGFKTYFEQYTFGRDIFKETTPRLKEKAEKVLADSRYSVGHLKTGDIDKYIEDFREVYNNAWARHSGVAAMSSAQARMVIKKMKPIMDPKLLWFAYFEGRPIGFFIMLPEVNQIFKHLNGKMNLWGKMVFLWHKYRKTNRKILGVIFGVDPAHQGKGVDGAIIIGAKKMLDTDRNYSQLEMNWIGDFNPKMINLVKLQVEGTVVKTHITYRKLFDENKPFKRMPVKALGLR